MKKTLSIILSLALLLCAVVVIPAFSVSADEVDYSKDYNKIVLLDSAQFRNVGSDTNQINPKTGAYWLDIGRIGGSRKDGFFLDPNKSSSGILAHNNAEQTDLTDFEWQFELASGNASSANSAKVSFNFHVNEKSNISSDSARRNVLAVTLFGANYTTTTKFQTPMALMAEWTNADGNLRPRSYDGNGVPNNDSHNCYIDMSNFANTDSNGNFTSFKTITINIQLVGRYLTVTVWETANESNKQTLQIEYLSDPFSNYTPSGDFSISTGANSCNMFINNMTITTNNDNVLLDTGKASKYNYKWWEANYIYAKDASTGAWGASSRTPFFESNGSSVRLHQNGVADRLLERSGSLPEGGVENFVWEFDYTVGRTWGGRTSFAFHVTDDSVTTGVTTTDDSGTVTNFSTPYASRNNLACITLFTGITPANGEISDGIVIQRPNGTAGAMRPLEYDTSVNPWKIKKGAIEFSESNGLDGVKKDLTAVNLNEKAGAVYYRVRIVYYEGYLYFYMWKKGDMSTMFSISEKIDNKYTPTAGDFSIINANNFSYVDNMTISSLDYDGSEAEVEYYKNAYKANCTHTYDNNCDTDCNKCGYVREVPGHNHLVDEDASTDATYFVAGKEVKVCEYCGDKVETVLDRITENAITFTPSYEGSKLTIKWVYSDELSIDIDKAIENANDVKLNIACTIGDEVVKNLPEFAATNDSGEIEIDGFNVARLDKTVALDLTFDFGGAYDTDLVAELNDTAKYNVVAKEVANKSADSSELNSLIGAIGAQESIVVNGNNKSCDDFDVAYSKVDIANATAEFKFTATNVFINAVKANSNYNDGRTVNLVVNIGGKDYTVKIDSLKTNITVKISGLSFSQMYGDITAKLVITYAADSGVGAIETNNIKVSFDDAIAASEDPAAVALEALMNK